MRICKKNVCGASFWVKLHRFLRSDDKFERMYRKVRQHINYLYYRRRFGAIGSDTVIIAPDRLIGCRHMFLGRDVSILHHARLETIEQYGGQVFSPRLIIGDGTSIGQNFHCIAGGTLIIGRDVLMSGNIYIADVLHEWRKVEMPVSSQPLQHRLTRIGDQCFIGYGAAILPGAILGDHCIVGSNAVVTPGEYPARSVLAGVPAKIIRQYDPQEHVWK